MEVGRPEDLKEGITDRWAAEGFFVVRRGDRVFAVSSTCTHKKVRLVVGNKGGNAGAGFKCPRHGSGFDAEGHATKAPARKPLPRYAVRLDDDGHLVVDRSRQFGERDWDDTDAVVRVPE